MTNLESKLSQPIVVGDMTAKKATKVEVEDNNKDEPTEEEVLAKFGESMSKDAEKEGQLF